MLLVQTTSRVLGEMERVCVACWQIGKHDVCVYVISVQRQVFADFLLARARRVRLRNLRKAPGVGRFTSSASTTCAFT
jgi:hypothetical protein